MCTGACAVDLGAHGSTGGASTRLPNACNDRLPQREHHTIAMVPVEITAGGLGYNVDSLAACSDDVLVAGLSNFIGQVRSVFYTIHLDHIGSRARDPRKSRHMARVLPLPPPLLPRPLASFHDRYILAPPPIASAVLDWGCCGDLHPWPGWDPTATEPA